jgi:hypothetical protein
MLSFVPSLRMSDSGSRMGAARRAQVHPRAVTVPLARLLNCPNTGDQAPLCCQGTATFSVVVLDVAGSNLIAHPEENLQARAHRADPPDPGRLSLRAVPLGGVGGVQQLPVAAEPP